MVRNPNELRELDENEKNLLERLVRIADAEIDDSHVPGSEGELDVIFPKTLYPLPGVILNHLRRKYEEANWKVSYTSTGLTNEWGLVWASNVMLLNPKQEANPQEQKHGAYEQPASN